MGSSSQRGASILPGVRLPERYEPIRRIARGGMASVWCAHDHTLDRQVAIKLLAEPYADDELAGRRFTREARAAARLSGHAHVVTIYDVGRSQPSAEAPLGRPFIVMEYLAGGTVADALRTGALDRALAVRWLHQAARALDYAHRRGVIHRDVKLANFLLDRERVLHVADFGIAQLGTEDTLTGVGQVLGTAGYLAPERVLGHPATEASDRYALAVAAFELLVGRRPFTAEPFTAQARQHLEEPPPRASGLDPSLPPAVDAVLARGMAKRQEDRFGSCLAFVESLERALAGGWRSAGFAGGGGGRLLVAGAGAEAPGVSRRAATPAAAETTSPVVPLARPVHRSSPRVRVAALVALAAALLGVALAAAATLVPAGGHPRLAARSRPLLARRPATRTATTHAATDRGSAPAATTTAPATGSPPPASTPAPPPSPAADAATLEAEGHQLMLNGDYRSAIPVLRQAVAAAPHSSLTYAYALYDLGRSLRLAGDPRAAVAVLWQRLQIPNQTNVVRNELALALEALGQQQAAQGQEAQRGQPPSGGAAPGDQSGGQGD